jgi:spore coat protein CotF
MQSHPYGAHEVIELHEVLNGAVDAINTAHLYAPFVRDPELAQIVRHQVQFMQEEYNGLVYAVQGLGGGELFPYRPARAFSTSEALMSQAAPMSGSQPYAAQIDDRDVASVMLGIHKTGAKLKMAAALETGHSQIRDLFLQGAVNCAHQAYEMWGYMQRKGYYAWTAMPKAANAQLLRGYQPVNAQAEQVERAASPAQPISENGTVPPQAMRETANGAGVAAPTNRPLTPVNASPIFSPPPPRQDYGAIGEETTVATDTLQTHGVEDMGILSQQTEGKQTRSRKKTAISDTYLGQ